MPSARTLFGKKIVPHHMLNYAEQIYDILVGEIETGRWQVDERLPGVIYLAKELGFGTKTIQTAYDRLKQDGYVRTLGYRGTYLKTQHPMTLSTQGRLGILVAEEQAAQPLIVWYEHVILQQARRRGLVPEIRVLPDRMDPGEVTRPGGLFAGPTWGILSLVPLHPMPPYEGGPDRVPAVYLVPPFEPCWPKVCADVREAYVELTSRLIRMGHIRIVFSEDTVEPDPRQTDLHRAGYLEAMRRHDLPVDEQAMDRARRVHNTDPGQVADHLRGLLEPPPGRRPTAVVAGSLGRSAALVRAARAMGIGVPRELSVASIGSAQVDGAEGLELTGMLPDFDRMVEQCFLLLDQQRQTGRCDFTQIHVRMHPVAGHTAGPAVPSDGPRPPT